MEITGCVNSIGCQKEHVNLYHSLYHDIISNEVTEQTTSGPGDEFEKLVVIPVQQQNNGCDFGVFAIAYATCLVYTKDPLTAEFDIQKIKQNDLILNLTPENRL